MKESIKNTAFNEMYNIAFFWMSEENAYSAYSILNMLQKLPAITDPMKAKCKEMKDNLDSSFPDYKDSVPVIDTKQIGEDEDSQWLCAATNVIANLFAMEAYEMAFSSLVNMSEEWKELHYQVVGVVSKMNNVGHISSWLMMHFLFALEINGIQKDSMKKSLEMIVCEMFPEGR